MSFINKILISSEINRINTNNKQNYNQNKIELDCYEKKLYGDY